MSVPEALSPILPELHRSVAILQGKSFWRKLFSISCDVSIFCLTVIMRIAVPGILTHKSTIIDFLITFQ